VTFVQRQADALALVAESALNAQLEPGSAGDRYQVVLHIEPPDEISPVAHHIVDGIGVSAETSRRLSCAAHHVEHWIDGGRTSLDNLVLLCRRHHTWVHEGGIGVEVIDEGAIFRRPDGRRIEPVPPLAWSGASVVPEDVNRRSLRGWDGTPFNVGYAIDVLRPQPASFR
jgi:hypothetical protein